MGQIISDFLTVITFLVILGLVWMNLDMAYLSIPAASITGFDQIGWIFALLWRGLASLVIGFIGYAWWTAPEREEG